MALFLSAATNARAGVMKVFTSPKGRRWTRELGALRRRQAQASTGTDAPRLRALAADCLETCDGMLSDLLDAETECRNRGEFLREEQRAWFRFFDAVPVPCVLSDAAGVILSANRAAALFLNVSAAHLPGRSLIHFVVDRDRLVQVLGNGQPAGTSRVALRIRPREQAATAIVATVVREGTASADVQVWFLLPAGRASVETMTSSACLRADHADEPADPLAFPAP